MNGTYAPLPQGSRVPADERLITYQRYTFYALLAILAVLVASLVVGSILLGVVWYRNSDTLSDASSALANVNAMTESFRNDYGALMRPFVPGDGIARPMGEEPNVIETARGLIMGARPMAIEIEGLVRRVLSIMEKGEDLENKIAAAMALAFATGTSRAAAVRHAGSGAYEPASE